MSLAAQVMDLMGRELRALDDLRASLTQERSAVQERDGEALQQAAGAKRQLLEQLESLTAERVRLLAKFALPASRAGFETLLGRLEPRERKAAESLWASVLEGLRACQSQNQANGLLLDTSLRTTQEALAILLGHPAREIRTYDSQGAISGGLSTRSFAKV